MGILGTSSHQGHPVVDLSVPPPSRFTSLRSSVPLPHPIMTEAIDRELRLESTLAELPLHTFHIEPTCTGQDLLPIFEQHPSLPGVTLSKNGQWLGMISRQRLLEFLIRPQGLELFLPQPLTVLHSYAQTNHLILSDRTTILAAAQIALRRLPCQQSEPIVVVSTDEGASHSTYRLLDIHTLNIAYWQIRGIETQVRYERTQAQMIQIEKMASLGRLVDGVAHEILDPVGFIWGNLVHLSTYTDQVLQLLKTYEKQFPNLPQGIIDLRNEMELDYLCQDIPQTIASIRAGANRLKNLALSLQNFCHVDDVYPKPADLHECLDSILLLLKSRLTGEIEIIRHYGHLPPVTCYAGQLNQVFMNILTNAVGALLNQAIRRELTDEWGGIHHVTQHNATHLNVLSPSSCPKPQITITTQIRSLPLSAELSSTSPRWVSIQIADNGPGLTPTQQQQILNSFSIEQRAAKETSLAMSYQIITAKHGGKLSLRSPAMSLANSLTNSQEHAAASGTEFEILLPLL